MNWHLLDFLLVCGLAIICGTVAQLTSGFERGGWFVHIGLGFAGAVLGAYLSSLLNLPVIYNVRHGDTNFPIIWSLVGAVFAVALIGFFVKPRRH
jgi:uncharacterized membrane protein YeaQ/YmgE (transglycosylase-associated protein family)